MVIVIILGLLLLGCDDCNPEGEPIVNISGDASAQFQKVYGLGRSDYLIQERSDHTWDLPMSLVSDYSTFVFESPGKTDTMTFVYDREAKFESNKCGIRVFLKNMRLEKPTTFSNAYVSSEAYGQGLFDLAPKKFSAHVTH